MDTRAPENALASVGPIDHYLAALHGRIAGVTDGEIATYIPELAKVDPELFGIAIATVDGKLYTVGDSSYSFTIQSISKAFVYGYTLAEYGRDYVLSRIGVEPTGEAFNSIILDEVHKRPFNPMVNAGAVAAAELIKGDTPEARIATMLLTLSRFAGRSLHVDGIRAPLGAGDRSPEPRDRLHDAELRHDPQPARNHPRYLFPPVLGARHLRRPGGDGRHLRQ